MLVQMDTPSSGPLLTRCSHLWYSDGSIVLQAETTVFRVYSGILSQYSPVFRGLFTVPQPESPEQYDGCPLVKLPDAERDIRYFLEAIHDIRSAQCLTTWVNAC